MLCDLVHPGGYRSPLGRDYREGIGAGVRELQHHHRTGG